MQPFWQPVEKAGLAGNDPLAGGIDGEPAARVDLRKFPVNARVARPLQSEGVADDSGRVQVVLQHPCMDSLAALLFQRAQFEECPVDGKTGFFTELAPGGLST